MTDRIPSKRYPRLAGAAAALLMTGLGGCANVGDSYMSGAFVDPAKYDLYDCAQLDAERKSLATMTANQQKLIDKARTGVAGTMVGEMAYRDDYIKIRASAKLADEVWRRDKCDAQPQAATASTPAAAPPPASRHPGNLIH
ncbi:MAG TPA: twin-arginine translocation pathway signal [Nitrobacter sp.]|jgi:hypothetical protein|nr:twin-arginine translocation pathway signal [Nitrobacter sp.]